MKKIIFIFFILAVSVYAQSERIDINLAEYEPDSGFSKISISNLYSTDLTNVKIKIDQSPEFLLTETFKSGGTVYKIINMPSGEHVITVTNDQGKTETKNLLFSLSKEEIIKTKEEQKKAEEELAKFESDTAKLAEENKLSSDIEIAKEKEKNIQAGVYEEKSTNKVLLIVIGAFVIGIIAMIWLIKRKSK